MSAENPTDLPGKVSEAVAEGSKVLQQFLATKTMSALDGLVADRLQFWRLKQATKLAERARALLAAEGVEPQPPPASVIVPLLEAGSLAEGEMAQRWAALLASAAHPAHGIQECLPRILAEMSPIDARTLDRIFELCVGAYCEGRGYMGIMPVPTPKGEFAVVPQLADHAVMNAIFRADLSTLDATQYLGEIVPAPASLNNLYRLGLITIRMVGPTTAGHTGVWVDFANRERPIRLMPLGQALVRGCLSHEGAARVRDNV